jgi:hypothetical protein
MPRHIRIHLWPISALKSVLYTDKIPAGTHPTIPNPCRGCDNPERK